MDCQNVRAFGQGQEPWHLWASTCMLGRRNHVTVGVNWPLDNATFITPPSGATRASSDDQQSKPGWARNGPKRWLSCQLPWWRHWSEVTSATWTIAWCSLKGDWTSTDHPQCNRCDNDGTCGLLEAGRPGQCPCLATIARLHLQPFVHEIIPYQ